MGMDVVELVMEVEEAFDITILDRHAEKIRTVGDLYRYILGKLDGKISGTPSCLSASAFYRLRRKLMAEFRVERRRVRPASMLDDLIPTAKRRAEWRRLEDGLGWTLPDLVRPDWVGAAFVGLLITLAAAIIFAWCRQDGFALESAGPALLLFLLGAFLLGAKVYLITKPLATGFPTPDVRGLIAMILASNVATIRNTNPHGWHPHEVWDILVMIIAEQLGVPRETIAESSSFVNDLGMD